MDILHDLVCYAVLFSSLRYLEIIMSSSSSSDLDKATNEDESANSKYRRDRISLKNNSSALSKTKSIKKEENTSVQISELNNVSANPELKLKSSSTTTTSDIIPIYEYSVKAASSTYMLNNLSSNYTNSLGHIPQTISFHRGGTDPPALLTDDYTTDHTSEYPMSSRISSNVRSSKSSMQVHVSSATTMLMNKVKRTASTVQSESTAFLDYQIELATKNIKKKLYNTDLNSLNMNELILDTKLSSNMNIPSDLPSTSKVISHVNKKLDINLYPTKASSQVSEISSGSLSLHPTPSKGATHQQLVGVLAQVTMQNYHSHQELNDSQEVAMIDEHVKLNRSIHASPTLSGSSSEYTSSEQFSNITGLGQDHLGEDDLYANSPIKIAAHKTLLDKRFVDRSPNGSMIAVLDFDVHEWSETFDSNTSAGTSKD